jgi:hypothetical protein
MQSIFRRRRPSILSSKRNCFRRTRRFSTCILPSRVSNLVSLYFFSCPSGILPCLYFDEACSFLHFLVRFSRQRKEGEAEAQQRKHAKIRYPRTPWNQPKKDPQEGPIFQGSPRRKRVHCQVLHHWTCPWWRRRLNITFGLNLLK